MTQRNGLLFILPWIIGFASLALYPIASSLYYSFTNFNGVGTPQWVGFGNYQRLMSDPTYRIAVVNTLYYVVIFVPASTVVSLGMALLLNQKRHGIAVYRTAAFIPSIVPLVASAAVWLWLLNPEYGSVQHHAERCRPAIQCLVALNNLGETITDIDLALAGWREYRHLPGWSAAGAPVPLRGGITGWGRPGHQVLAYYGAHAEPGDPVQRGHRPRR